MRLKASYRQLKAQCWSKNSLVTEYAYSVHLRTLMPDQVYGLSLVGDIESTPYKNSLYWQKEAYILSILRTRHSYSTYAWY